MEGYDVLYAGISGTIEMLISFHFFAGFFRKKVQKIDTFLFILSGIFAVAFIVSVPISPILKDLLYILLFYMGGICICKAKRRIIIFYAAITITIMQLSYGVFHSLCSFFLPLLWYEDVGENFGVICILIMLFSSIFSLLLCMFCYHILHKYFSAEEVSLEEIERHQNLVFLQIPVFLVAFVSEYINKIVYGNTIVIENNKLIKSSDTMSGNYIFVLLIQLFGILSLFCVMDIYKKMGKELQLKSKLMLLQQEKGFLLQYVEETKKRYERTKSFRHDIKNHILVVKELLRQNQYDLAFIYIGGMDRIADGMLFSCNTNHPIVTVLLEKKLGLAKSMGISVHCSLILPYPCKIEDIDFCIILSNALDNAIYACYACYACQETEDHIENYIDVTGVTQGDMVMLEVENRFLGDNTLQEGTGLANIKAVAEKYHGTVTIKREDFVFTLSVLLMIPE